jgi:hypothetical protein
MKKFIFSAFFLLMTVQLYPCDACGSVTTGGYIGIMPQFSRHFVGIRYQMRYFSAVSAVHPHNGVANEEYYHTWNIMGRINPHKRVQIFINAPIHYFLQIDQGVKRELAGPGDIWTLAQYQVIRTPDSSAKVMRQSWFIGGGIKLPTGRFKMYDTLGVYDRNMQPGTGSWDFLFTTQYTVRWKGWGLNTELNARISTDNPDNYLYGHKFNGSIKGFYWGKGDKVSVLAAAGVIYDGGLRDTYLYQKMPNSGGHMVSVAANADLYFKRWIIGAEFRMPVYANMSSGLLNPGPQLMSQVMFTF